LSGAPLRRLGRSPGLPIRRTRAMEPKLWSSPTLSRTTILAPERATRFDPSREDAAAHQTRPAPMLKRFHKHGDCICIFLAIHWKWP
jgi:hypothetical protein